MTTFVFRVRNIPAALYKAMGGFATNGVNMTKLESYMIDGPFTATQFYADIEGHPEEPRVRRALEELGFFTDHLQMLGVYTRSSVRAIQHARADGGGDRSGLSRHVTSARGTAALWRRRPHARASGPKAGRRLPCSRSTAGLSGRPRGGPSPGPPRPRHCPMRSGEGTWGWSGARSRAGRGGGEGEQSRQRRRGPYRACRQPP